VVALDNGTRVCGHLYSQVSDDCKEAAPVFPRARVASRPHGENKQSWAPRRCAFARKLDIFGPDFVICSLRNAARTSVISRFPLNLRMRFSHHATIPLCKILVEDVAGGNGRNLLSSAYHPRVLPVKCRRWRTEVRASSCRREMQMLWKFWNSSHVVNGTRLRGCCDWMLRPLCATEVAISEHEHSLENHKVLNS